MDLRNKNEINIPQQSQSAPTTPSLTARTINFNDVESSNVGKQEQSNSQTQRTSSGETQIPLKSNMKKSRSVSEELAQLAPPKVVSMWKEFANFAFQGNVIDLSIGLIMGMFFFS